MWKRIQRPGREREKQISNPVLIETTYDEKTLGRIPNISDLQPTSPASYTSPAYAGHNITDVSTELPTLPL